jgi:transcriptional regulator with XRE-family HTH domain
MTEIPETTTGKKPHQGKTLRMLRNLLGKTQAQVAKDNNMSQSKIFDLEMKEELSDKELDVFSKYYGVSVLFLKRFDVDALAHGDVITNYNTLHDHSSLNSTSNFQEGSTQNNNYVAEQAFESMRENSELKTEIMRLRMKYEPEDVEKEIKNKKK